MHTWTSSTKSSTWKGHPTSHDLYGTTVADSKFEGDDDDEDASSVETVALVVVEGPWFLRPLKYLKTQTRQYCRAVK